jgi:hypothetical protein
MKSQAQRELAEKMYVQEGRTYKEIGIILDVTEKTVWSWGRPETGNWEAKRANFLKSKMESYQEQYKMLVSVCRQINTTLDANAIPHQNLITLYNNLTAGIKKTKDFEDGMKKAELDEGKKGNKTISQETIKNIEENIFGL